MTTSVRERIDRALRSAVFAYEPGSVSGEVVRLRLQREFREHTKEILAVRDEKRGLR